MKGFFKPKLILPLVTVVLLAAAIAVSLMSGSIKHSHAASAVVRHIQAKGLASNSAVTAPTGPNLIYHKPGPVMASTVKVFVIFWQPKGFPVPAGYNNLVKRYYRDIGDSSLYDNNEQYTDSSGTSPDNAVLAGAFLDTTPYPANPLTDAQLRTEIAKVTKQHHLPTGLKDYFPVYTGSGEQVCLSSTLCSNVQICGYHSFFGSTIYASLPFLTPAPGCLANVPQTPNNDLAADGALDVSSHEQMEAATDPNLNAWFDINGNEIGNKCNFFFGPLTLDHGKANIKLNGHFYILQQEWSNIKGGCTLTGP